MENEILTNEVTDLTDLTEVEVYDMEPVDISGGGNLGKVALGVGIIAGACAVAYKCRGKIKDKITEHKIKQLEKKGYVVSQPEPELVADNVVEFEGDIVDDEE